jgi:hypothetical protein
MRKRTRPKQSSRNTKRQKRENEAGRGEQTGTHPNRKRHKKGSMVQEEDEAAVCRTTNTKTECSKTSARW